MTPFMPQGWNFFFFYASRIETTSKKRGGDKTHDFVVSKLVMLTIQKAGKMFRFLIEYQYADELASIYICYSTGDWFNTLLSNIISTCVQL